MKSIAFFISAFIVLSVSCTSNRSDSFSNLFDEDYKNVIVDLDTSFNHFLNLNYGEYITENQVTEFLEDVAMLTDTNWQVPQGTSQRISNNYVKSGLAAEFGDFNNKNLEFKKDGLYLRNLENCCSLNPAVRGYLEMYESGNIVSQGILAASLNESISKMNFLSEGVRTIILFELYLPIVIERTTLPNNQ